MSAACAVVTARNVARTAMNAFKVISLKVIVRLHKTI
jgi:hypothetical protein